jgi:hypothetical protein
MMPVGAKFFEQQQLLLQVNVLSGAAFDVCCSKVKNITMLNINLIFFILKLFVDLK